MNNTSNISTEDISQKKLPTSEFLLVLKEKQFSSHEFSVYRLISKSSFYAFNNKLH